MDVRVHIILLLVLTQRKWMIHSTTVSRSVSEHVNFIHEVFPVPSSMRAIIEVAVYYPYYESVSSGDFPVLGLYTTEDHINIRSQCTHTKYGQLGNFNLHPSITLDRHESRPLKCAKYTTNTIHCTGDITAQDFIPRKFSFSFGFHCKDINVINSLKGLSYKISIHGQTNVTNCVALSLDSVKVCYRYSHYGVFPNLVGGTNLKELSFHYLSGYSSLCYHHEMRFLCYLYLPKCELVYKRIIHPCREMCHDYLNACRHLILIDFDCNYLPPWGGNIPCFYHIFSCTEPPKVKNAVVVRRNNTALYSCTEDFTLVGNKNITCKSTGRWPRPPQCLFIKPKELIEGLFAPLISLYVMINLVVIITVICTIKLRANRTHGLNRVEMQAELPKDFRRKEVPAISAVHLKRNREFDAFVLYHFDTDDDFVINHPLPQLEEVRDFKLCIHNSNFVPGRDIKDNIEEAIEGSNSAIIVMSQGFVDSMWCKEEFTHCYIENMKDAAFNLFVIMMQPVETLVNMSLYMKTFFANKTYLQVNDPELFNKLAAHMQNAKQPQYDNDDDYDVHSDGREDDFKLILQDGTIDAEETKA